MSSQNAVLQGTSRIFLAEALLLPTGLVTAAFLTRSFGPSDYGLFTLAATIISWFEWTVASLFARATFKFAAEASDWRPLGTKVVRLHLITGCLAAVLVWLLSDLFASWLEEPMLAPCLKWFAIDIPLFSVVHAYRNLLVGLGRFNARAVISAVRWLVRLAGIVMLVQLGLSLEGAILGSILATLMELIVARMFIKPSIFQSSDFPVRKLWDYAVPLFLFGFSMRIFEKADLVLLKAMGGSAADAGFYGAAQNLSMITSLFSLSFAPVLLSRISNLLNRGEEEEAKELGRNSLVVVLALFPFAAMTAGASNEIVPLIFGAMFKETAPILDRLIFSGVLQLGISVMTAILTAKGRPGITFALAGPLVPISVIGYALVIPYRGAVGAATVNLIVALLGTVASIVVLRRIWGISPQASAILRGALISAIAYILAAWWQTENWLLVLKLLCISMIIVIGFYSWGSQVRGLFYVRTKSALADSNPDVPEWGR